MLSVRIMDDLSMGKLIVAFVTKDNTYLLKQANVRSTCLVQPIWLGAQHFHSS